MKVFGISMNRAKTLSLDLFTLLTAGKSIGIESTIIMIEVTNKVSKRSFFSLDLVYNSFSRYFEDSTRNLKKSLKEL
jgi:hypothetical protein